MREFDDSAIPPLKPLDVVNRIIDLLDDNADDFPAESQDEPIELFNDSGNSRVIILFSGRLDIWRHFDNRLIETASVPTILGLQGSEYRSRQFYIKLAPDSIIKVISQKKAIDLIEIKGMWRDLFDYLGYLNDNKLHRDMTLISATHYEKVCFLLKELAGYSDQERARLSVAEFILRRTPLARSGVMKVLSDLRFGGYIDMVNGKLIGIIKTLPEKY